MQVIKNRQLDSSPMRHLADSDELPSGAATVSLSRWRTQRDALIEHGDIGVRLAPDEDVVEIVDDVNILRVIALEFHGLTEGRGYSQARLLREHGYRGEIRALGVMRDQLAFLERCGVDVFELSENEDGAQALAAFSEIPVRYQPAADGETLVFRRRSAWRATT